MRKLHYPKIRRAIAAGLVVLGFAGAAQAELIVGLTTQNQLISFDSATPGTINAGGVVMGLTTGDELVGIDFRPSPRPQQRCALRGWHQSHRRIGPNLYVEYDNGGGYASFYLGCGYR